MADEECLHNEFGGDWAWYNMEIRGSKMFHYGGNEQGSGLMMGSSKGDDNKIIMQMRHSINGRNWQVRNIAIAFKNFLPCWQSR